jgi:hypothetical protein
MRGRVIMLDAGNKKGCEDASGDRKSGNEERISLYALRRLEAVGSRRSDVKTWKRFSLNLDRWEVGGAMSRLGNASASTWIAFAAVADDATFTCAGEGGAVCGNANLGWYDPGSNSI